MPNWEISMKRYFEEWLGRCWYTILKRILSFWNTQNKEILKSYHFSVTSLAVIDEYVAWLHLMKMLRMKARHCGASARQPFGSNFVCRENFHTSATVYVYKTQNLEGIASGIREVFGSIAAFQMQGADDCETGSKSHWEAGDQSVCTHAPDVWKDLIDFELPDDT